jgi:hypothetical protein
MGRDNEKIAFQLMKQLVFLLDACSGSQHPDPQIGDAAGDDASHGPTSR